MADPRRTVETPRDPHEQLARGIEYDDVGDLVRAAHWYQMAARSGSVEAQVLLGVAYLFGKGVREDHATAYEWFYKAANQGSANAQYFVGVCNEQGCGIPQNIGAALGWYKAAADAGDQDAIERLGELEEVGKVVERRLRCPHCAQVLRLPDPTPSGVARCKTCTGRFRIKIDEFENIFVTPLGANDDKSPELSVERAFEIIGLDPSAPPDSVRAAWKRLIQDYHPDRVAKMGEKLRRVAEQESKQLNEAYQYLKRHGYTK